MVGVNPLGSAKMFAKPCARILRQRRLRPICFKVVGVPPPPLECRNACNFVCVVWRVRVVCVMCVVCAVCFRAWCVVCCVLCCVVYVMCVVVGADCRRVAGRRKPETHCYQNKKLIYIPEGYVC